MSSTPAPPTHSLSVLPSSVCLSSAILLSTCPSTHHLSSVCVPPHHSVASVVPTLVKLVVTISVTESGAYSGPSHTTLHSTAVFPSLELIMVAICYFLGVTNWRPNTAPEHQPLVSMLAISGGLCFTMCGSHPLQASWLWALPIMLSWSFPSLLTWELLGVSPVFKSISWIPCLPLS